MTGLAAMLYAAVALQRVGAPLDGQVALVFVPDEETGGRRGSGFLAATPSITQPSPMCASWADAR